MPLYAVSRDDRAQDIVAGAGQTVFGPLDFDLLDSEDMQVWRETETAGLFEPVAEPYAVAGVGGFPTVIFSQGRTLAELLRFKSARLDARKADVTQGGAIRSVPLEHELQRFTKIGQELRRDIDYANGALVIEHNAQVTGLAQEILDRQDGDRELQAEIDALMLSNGNMTDAVLSQLRVVTRSLSAPPGAPGTNAIYILGPLPSGDWAGHNQNDLARWNEDTDEWDFFEPAIGYRAWIIDEAIHAVFVNYVDPLNSTWIRIPDGRSGVDLRGFFGVRGTGAANQRATSASSRTIGLGILTFTTQAGKDFRVEDYVRGSANSDPTGKWMIGTVVSYVGTALTLDITEVAGAGTFALWVLEIDDTPRVQAALDAYPTGANFFLVGNMKCGQLTYPGFNPYTFDVDGKIYVPEGQWFEIAGRLRVYGRAGGGDIQFGQIRCMSFVGSETSPYVVHITTAAVKQLENVIVEPPKFIGFYVDGTVSLNALTFFKNVSCQARALVTSIPFVADHSFWNTFEKCTFLGAVGGPTYTMEFRDTRAGDGYTGLTIFDDVKISVAGILVSNVTSNLTPRFTMRKLLSESFAAGVDLITIDMGATSMAVNWEFDQVSMEDANTDCYMLNSIGAGQVRSFAIRSDDMYQTKVKRPTSKRIVNLRSVIYRQFPYNVAISPTWPASNPHAKHSTVYSDGYQGRWISQPRGPALVPRAPLPVLQDPAAMTGPVLLGGATATPVRDPWGGMKAVEVGGTNGGSIRILDAATPVALGDAFLVTSLLRSTVLGKTAPMPLLSLDVGAGTAYVLDGLGASIFVGVDDDNRTIDDLAWKWLRALTFVTTAGSSGSAFIRYSLLRDTSVALSQYCMPGIIHFPASEDWSAGDMIDIAHSLAPFPSNAAAATLVAPLGASLLVNGAVEQVGDNAQMFGVRTLTELLTIAAAATTDTALSLPAGAIILAVSVRVTTIIPTAANFTVTGATSGTTFSTAAVLVAAGTTNKGTAAGAYYNAAAQKVRITPNLNPAANTGRVRVTVHYIDITPATS